MDNSENITNEAIDKGKKWIHEKGTEITEATQTPVQNWWDNLGKHYVDYFVNELLFSYWWTAPLFYIVVIALLYIIIKCLFTKSKKRRCRPCRSYKRRRYYSRSRY